MRKILLAVFCSVCLMTAVDATAGQQTQTPEKKDKNTAEKTADKAKEAGQEVGEKAGDVKDKTVKGAKKTGEITAAEAWIAFEAGAYPGSPVGPGCMCVFACYDIPNARVEGPQRAPVRPSGRRGFGD